MISNKLGFLKFSNNVKQNSIDIIEATRNILKTREMDANFIQKTIDLLIESGISQIDGVVRMIQNNIEKYLIKRISDLQIDTTLKPQVIMLLGVNGAGKTTTSFKMASLLKKHEWGISVVSSDTIRPGAVFQFEELSKKVNISTFYNTSLVKTPDFIANEYSNSVVRKDDVFIIDTPGVVVGNVKTLNYINKVIKRIHKLTPKEEIKNLLVIDANIGSDLEHQISFVRTKIKIDGIFISKIELNANIGKILALAKKLNIPINGFGNGINIDDIHQVTPSIIANHIFNYSDLKKIIDKQNAS